MCEQWHQVDYSTIRKIKLIPFIDLFVTKHFYGALMGERSLGGGSGNSLQHSCLENSMDRGAWWATVHGVTKSQTQLSN